MPEDEEEVRDLERRYDAAWGRQDLDGVLACLATDATILTPHGVWLCGLEEIRNGLSALWAESAGGLNHRTEIAGIHFLAPMLALVDGVAFITARDGTRLRHRFTDIVCREQGRWLVKHVRAQPAWEEKREERRVNREEDVAGG